MRTTEVALIVIDMQRDFLLPGGFGEALGNDVSGMLAIVPTVQNLIAEARLAGIKVIHTRENHEPDGSDLLNSKYYRGMVGKRIGDPSPLGGRLLIKGDYGADIVDECAPLPGELVIDAAGKGKFWNTNLDRELKAAGITQLIMAGVTSEVCVQTTAREANDRGYEIILATDSTQSYFPEFKSSTIDMVKA